MKQVADLLKQTIKEIEDRNQGDIGRFGHFGDLKVPKTLHSLAKAPASQVSVDAPPIIFPHQKQVGKAIFERIHSTLRSSEVLGRILVILPNLNNLLAQTEARINSFCDHYSINKDLWVIIKCHKNACDTVNKFWETVEKEEKKLFIVVHDEAHWGIGKSPDRTSSRGLADSFLNRRHHNEQQREAKNVVRLMVSATPYSLQTRNSRIPKENEIHWDEAINDPGMRVVCVYGWV